MEILTTRKPMKYLVLLVTVLFVFTLFPAQISHADSKCGDNITWKISGKTLILNGSGEMYDYDVFETPWDAYSNDIQSIVFNGNITRIGKYAFSWCVDLRSVVIPSSVRAISEGAFHKCTSLSSVVIPDSVVTIGAWAFFCCDFTSVYIPSSVTVIGDDAFSFCYKLVKVSGGAKLKVLGYEAFADCPRLKTFVITSKQLSKIGPYCFTGDKSLKTIYIKNTTKLSKSGVKKSLKGSSVKTVKVKKSKVKKYKKIFKKSNSGRKVKVKK